MGNAVLLLQPNADVAGGSIDVYFGADIHNVANTATLNWNDSTETKQAAIDAANPVGPSTITIGGDNGSFTAAGGWTLALSGVLGGRNVPPWLAFDASGLSSGVTPSSTYTPAGVQSYVPAVSPAYAVWSITPSYSGFAFSNPFVVDGGSITLSGVTNIPVFYNTTSSSISAVGSGPIWTPNSSFGDPSPTLQFTCQSDTTFGGDPWGAVGSVSLTGTQDLGQWTSLGLYSLPAAAGQMSDDQSGDFKFYPQNNSSVDYTSFLSSLPSGVALSITNVTQSTAAAVASFAWDGTNNVLTISGTTASFSNTGDLIDLKITGIPLDTYTPSFTDGNPGSSGQPQIDTLVNVGSGGAFALAALPGGGSLSAEAYDASASQLAADISAADGSVTPTVSLTVSGGGTEFSYTIQWPMGYAPSPTSDGGSLSAAVTVTETVLAQGGSAGVPLSRIFTGM
jgi:hypothetical protein